MTSTHDLHARDVQATSTGGEQVSEPPSWQPPTGGEPTPAPPPPPSGPPGYGTLPSYGATPYGTPGYGTPGYGTPGYGTPGYQQPYAVAAPKPGIIPLRPLAVGEILDGAFAAIRRHPRAVLGLSAAAACIQQAAVLLVRAGSGSLNRTQTIHFSDNNSSSQSSMVTVYSTVGGTLLISTLVGCLLTGMLCLIISDSVLGQPTSVRSAWIRLKPLTGRWIAVSVIASVAECLGLALCAAPGIFLWGVWAFVMPALVLERTTVTGAFSRSWALVKGSFWRVWGIRALSALIAVLLNGVVGLIAGVSALHDIFSNSANPTVIHISTFTIVLSAVLAVVAATLTAPFLSGVVTLLYVDRRIRAEALDVQLQQASASPSPTFG